MVSEKKKFNKNYRNHRVLIFTNDTVQSYPVVNIYEGRQIETPDDILTMEDCKKVYDIDSGGIMYLFNLDMPARLESTKLKELRRSVAIQNIFSYDRQKPFDIMKLIPYVIAILAIVFS